MRIKNIFATVMLAAVCTSASAQFATPSNTGTSATANVPSEDWSSVYVQYSPITVEPDGGDDLDFSGISVGFNKYTSISQSMPLFLEYGAALQYSWYSDSYEDYYDEYDITYSLFSLKAPVNVSYAFNIPNSKITIAPYAGINLRYNFSGKVTFDDGDDEEDFDLFDKDDMGSKDATWKRFQIGWQIGVNVNFEKAYLGLSYGSDFTEIVKDCKVNTTSITLGYKF